MRHRLLAASAVAVGIIAGSAYYHANSMLMPIGTQGASGGGGGGGPIAFVGFGDLGQVVGSTTLTNSYSVHTGTDTALIVCVYPDADNILSVIDTTAAVSGSLMVKNTSLAAGGRFAQAWIIPLGNTTAGSHSITITASGSDNIASPLGEYSKMQQGTTPDTSTARSVGTTTDNVPLTTTQSGDWYVGCTTTDGIMVDGSNTTVRGTVEGSGLWAVTDSNGTLSVGSNSMQLVAGGADFINSANTAMKTD